MWIMMLVSPTPGGSGFAEFVFSKYLGEFLPSAGVAIAMAILWRLISYCLLYTSIGDVEYQGDKTKAIFYYIANDRVDFRKLIKILAETFHIRIEMKQIGARQEAGRIGGIGSCGRKLCCSTFITNFISVSTSAARYQDISLRCV